MKCKIELYCNSPNDRLEMINFAQSIQARFDEQRNTITIEIEQADDATKAATTERAIKFAEAYRFHSIQFIKS